MFKHLKKFKRLKNENGQTMVEYILLLIVVIAICQTLFAKLNEYLLEDPDSFQNKYLNSYKSTMQGGNDGFSGQYKFFTIRR